MRICARWTSLLALIAVVAAAPAAHAAPSAADKAAADALYEEAKKLMAAGSFDAACPKLAESQRLDPGVGTLLTLGECYDHTGKKASAWETFKEAAALANTRGQRSREKIARTRVAALEPNLARIVIDVPAGSEAPGIVVRRDDQTVAKPVWGTQIPVDAGEHTVVATAPGRKTWSLKVRVERERELATVSVPPLAADEAPPSPIAKPAQPVASKSPQRLFGFIAGGLGLAGIGAGIGLGVVAMGKHNDAQAHCKPTCAAGGGDAIQADAKHFALGSTIGFVAGGTLLAAGVVLVIAAPSAKAATGAISVAPIVSGDVRGAAIGGVF